MCSITRIILMWNPILNLRSYLFTPEESSCHLNTRIFFRIVSLEVHIVERTPSMILFSLFTRKNSPTKVSCKVGRPDCLFCCNLNASSVMYEVQIVLICISFKFYCAEPQR